ncbi:MAG TPA: right-handed parallel beta-helix repeat-containing protein [Kofleriaceae bacterium]|nr:right-handed parallel beta-helix repeat-containing protein [Kofleriaceae bacterium]
MMRLAPLAPAVWLFVAASAAGCTRDNPRFCEESTACGDGFRCDVAANECVPLGAEDGPVMCETAMECAAQAPVCEDNVCAACTEGSAGDAVCAGRGDGLPRCVGGGCVACIDNSDCGAAAPVCEDNACRPCARHDECDSQVCDQGQCVAASAIIYVDADVAGGDSDTCGTQAEPCQTVSGPAGALRRVDTTRSFIRLLPAAGDYREDILVDGLTATIIGPGITITDIAETQASLVAVRGGGDLTLDGVTLSGLPGVSDAVHHAIECEGGSRIALEGATVDDNGEGTTVGGILARDCQVEVADSTISDQTGIGIDVEENRVEVVRSLILQNRDGGIRIVGGAAFRVVNNVIAENGFNDIDRTPFGGILIDNPVDPGEQVLAFNTIVDNEAKDNADASGVSCAVIEGSVTAVDNIVYFGAGAGGNAVAGTCEWETSVIENGGDLGASILTDDPLLTDRAGGDFTLRAGSPCIDSGKPVGGVTTDRFGVMRDAKPDIGAHERAP